jgi:formamidopyrimidine-DNA glycosylase
LPELPEVETVRRGLIQILPGRRFVDVKIRQNRLRKEIPASALRKHLPGQTVKDIRRRGKYLLIGLSQGGTILLHLGMSGVLIIDPPENDLYQHDHLLFIFDRGELRFRDPRRFGLVDWISDGHPEQHPLLASLGPEPDDPEFNLEYCLRRAFSSSRPIKNWLMDGRFVAGVGNIYASEALFAAGIRPDRPAGNLTAGEWKRLIHALRGVLKEAIEQGGTTLKDRGFKDLLGKGGRFQHHLRVYGRAGEPCTACNDPVQKVMLAGRSTFYCPACQK